VVSVPKLPASLPTGPARKLVAPAYALYERRLISDLTSAYRNGAQRPRHVAVLCDGNRRWARDSTM
jgi:short-chain Z-isoprenyl diphosphate synthase